MYHFNLYSFKILSRVEKYEEICNCQWFSSVRGKNVICMFLTRFTFSLRSKFQMCIFLIEDNVFLRET